MYAYQNNISYGSRYDINNINMFNGNLNISRNGIFGLSNDVQTSSAVNKSYIDSYYKTPNGTDYMIQINDYSTNDLKVSIDTDIKKILVNGTLVCGSSHLTNNQINNINEPIDKYDAATKNYVDNINKKKLNNIVNSNSVTYTTSQFINGVIIRTGLTNDKTIDYLPNTLDVINQGINNFTFNIFNSNVSSLISLQILPSDNKTIIKPAINILYGNYQLTANCIIDNDILNVIITNNSLVTSNSLNYTNIPYVNNVRTTDYLLQPALPINIPYNKSIIYTVSNIYSKIIIRGLDLTQDITDYFNIDETIDDTLGLEFVIFNVSLWNISLSYNEGLIVTIPSGYNCLLLYTNKSIIKLALLNRSQ